MSSACTNCRQVFATPYLLKRHLSRKTPCSPPGDERTSCAACGKSFSRRSNMLRHARTTCRNDPVADLEAKFDAKLEKISNEVRLQKELRTSERHSARVV